MVNPERAIHATLKDDKQQKCRRAQEVRRVGGFLVLKTILLPS
jgi:hypothetical protein